MGSLYVSLALALAAASPQAPSRSDDPADAIVGHAEPPREIVSAAEAAPEGTPAPSTAPDESPSDEATPGQEVLRATEAEAASEASTPEAIAEVTARVVANALERGEPSDAPYLHTLALEAELDGDYPRALELLRAASRLAPDDGLIAFDLARVALLHGGGDGDLEPFWRADVDGEDARALRVAVAERLDREIPVPDDEELLPPWLQGRVSAGLAVDSNIAVTPGDAPSHLTAARLSASGSFAIEALRDPVDVDVTAMFDLGKYLDDSDLIANYDAFTLVLGGTLRYDVHPFSLTVSLAGTELINDNFQSVFMQGVDVDADFRVAWQKWHLGGYFGFGGRDYVAGNVEDPVLGLDRDGGNVRLGLAWDWSSEVFGGPLGLRGRVGWAHEATEGELYQVHSMTFFLMARFWIEPIETLVGFGNDVRVYPADVTGAVDDEQVRVDNRFAPFARVGIAITERFVVYGTYSFTDNASSVSPTSVPDASGSFGIEERDFDYSRHIGELGVEVRL